MCTKIDSEVSVLGDAVTYFHMLGNVKLFSCQKLMCIHVNRYIHICTHNLFIRGGRCSVTISETKKTGLRRVGVDRKGVQDCRHRRLECACPWQLRYTYIEMGARRRSASRRPTPPHDRRNMFYKSSFTFSHTSNRGIGACFWHKSLFLFLSSENKSPK